MSCVMMALAGCSKSPEIATVNGTVKIDGKALPGALILFEPKEGPKISSAGVTDDNGEFHLTANDQREGALVGTHKVVIRSSAKFAVVADKEGDLDESASQPKAELVPSQYTQFDRTPLEQEVSAGENHVTIEIPAGPKPVEPAP